MNKVYEENFEVIYTTLLREDDFGIYLNIIWKMEELFKSTVHQLYGDNQHIQCHYSNNNQLFFITVDNNIKFKGFISRYNFISKEPIFDMGKCMADYEITEDEIRKVYDSDPALLMEPDPCIMKYRCMLSLSLADDVCDKYYDIAEKILSSIIAKKIETI